MYLQLIERIQKAWGTRSESLPNAFEKLMEQTVHIQTDMDYLLLPYKYMVVSSHGDSIYPKWQLHLHAEVKAVTCRGKERYNRW